MANIMEVAEKLMRGEISDASTEVAELEKLLAEMGRTEDGRQELAETVAIYIDKVWPKYDIAPMIADSKSFRYGEKPEFKMKKKGITAYVIAPNSYVPKSRNTDTSFYMDFESISVRPEAHIAEIEAGRATSIAELVSDAQEAIGNTIAAKVYTLLGQVYNETATPDHFVACTTTLDPVALNESIDMVTYRTGIRPVIIGDALLTGQITDFTGYSEVAKEEIRTQGYIGKYRGANIVALPEITDEMTGGIIFPKNRLYIVSRKIGYTATYGPSRAGQETNLDDWSWNMRLDRSWGFVVTDKDGLYVVEVN